MGSRIVRRATAADAEALADLRAEMFDDMGGATADDGWHESAREWFARRMDDPAYCFAVVDLDGVVVSCAVGFRRDTIPSPGNPSGGDVHVNNVCTLPEHRGRGYATAALAEVMRWAGATGVGRGELMATAAGRGLYERVGFSVHAYPAMRARLPVRVPEGATVANSGS
ncbi:MAG TPA: GNAT family N-acetyltransferase [Propionibacterium sp.]|jgi:GNAT superfamily N-acetyltransferase|nr:GNAT family N-acetyltransferase [Propionibacterium sp.]